MEHVSNPRAHARGVGRAETMGDRELRDFANVLHSVNDLSEAVSVLEPDRKAVPILLKQYLNLGGQILEFTVDRKFSNVLDGLI